MKRIAKFKNVTSDDILNKRLNYLKKRTELRQINKDNILIPSDDGFYKTPLAPPDFLIRDIEAEIEGTTDEEKSKIKKKFRDEMLKLAPLTIVDTILADGQYTDILITQLMALWPRFKKDLLKNYSTIDVSTFNEYVKEYLSNTSKTAVSSIVSTAKTLLEKVQKKLDNNKIILQAKIAKAEQDKKDAEAKRLKAEQARLKAEQDARDAEAKKQTAMTIAAKLKAEKDAKDAEAARVKAEKDAKDAEAARLKAEAKLKLQEEIKKKADESKDNPQKLQEIIDDTKTEIMTVISEKKSEDKADILDVPENKEDELDIGDMEDLKLESTTVYKFVDNYINVIRKEKPKITLNDIKTDIENKYKIIKIPASTKTQKELVNWLVNKRNKELEKMQKSPDYTEAKMQEFKKIFSPELFGEGIKKKKKMNKKKMNKKNKVDFNVLLGEVLSGNDNKKILKEYKRF
jgi:hypothetical protein